MMEMRRLARARGSGVGGLGVLSFFSYVGSGQASTVHPQKYQEFQAPPKNNWIFRNQKITSIMYLDLKKIP